MREGEEFSAHGRDEMNLAEFPLGTLSDRAPAGEKTLEFEDRIFDESRNEWVTRRLTISASDKYGLPTALDDEVILGLIQLTKEQKFADRKVPFSRYRLVEVLGWRDEGRSYRRLETSLRRWLGVTLYYDKAWRDNAAKAWVDESFHILDQLTIRRRDRGDSDASARYRSSFTWNETIFRSFQAGFLKQLDWDLFRSFKLPTTKRMYRFLDKRFFHRANWEFSLKEFAFEHIGLSRSYDTGQVKRKLMPAVKELEAVNFIERLPPESRFTKVGRGDWRIVVTKKSRRDKPPLNSDITAVAQLLIDRGVSPYMAKRLHATHAESEIRKQVEAFDAMIQRGNHQTLRRPAGFLVASIKQKFNVTAEQGRAGRLQPRRPTVVVSPPQLVPGEFDRAQAYLANLSASDRAVIESQAMLAVEGFLRKRYEAALAKSQADLAAHYKAGIVARYVSTLLPA
jgi:hypothetical protein